MKPYQLKKLRLDYFKIDIMSNVFILVTTILEIKWKYLPTTFVKKSWKFVNDILKLISKKIVTNLIT